MLGKSVSLRVLTTINLYQEKQIIMKTTNNKKTINLLVLMIVMISLFISVKIIIKDVKLLCNQQASQTIDGSFYELMF